MTGTRDTTDHSQWISCGVTVTDFGAVGFCAASAPTGEFKICHSAEPEMLAQMRAVNRTSYIVFRTDADATCSSLRVMNGSQFAPANATP